MKKPIGSGRRVVRLVLVEDAQHVLALFGLAAVARILVELEAHGLEGEHAARHAGGEQVVEVLADAGTLAGDLPALRGELAAVAAGSDRGAGQRVGDRGLGGVGRGWARQGQQDRRGREHHRA